MDELTPPPAQDVARVIRSTLADTEAALTEYYVQGGFFNYGTSQRVAGPVLAHTIPLSAALSACALDWSATGATQNAQVVKRVWAHGESRKIAAYPLAPREFRIRSDLGIRVTPTCYFVEGGRASIFCLQPRRGFALSVDQLALFAAIVRMRFLIDDFEAAGLEILDLSVPAGSKVRRSRVWTLETLPALSSERVEMELQKFARAYDNVRAAGVKRPKRPERRKDEGTRDLFDPDK